MNEKPNTLENPAEMLKAGMRQALCSQTVQGSTPHRKRSSAPVLTSPRARDKFQNSLLPQGLLKEAREAQITNGTREGHGGRSGESGDSLREEQEVQAELAKGAWTWLWEKTRDSLTSARQLRPLRNSSWDHSGTNIHWDFGRMAGL